MCNNCNECNDCAVFEKKLAIHSAPALLGIKAANLLSLDKNELDVSANADSFNLRASKKGLKIRILCDCGRRVLILLYSEKLLAKLLGEKERRAMLRSFGYSDDLDTDGCLEILAERTYGSAGFPHEIGLFLGYPIEDVKGFIDHKGDDFKLCGYWKVYGNPDAAKRTFDNYDKCRRFLCNKLDQGLDIYQALRIS